MTTLRATVEPPDGRVARRERNVTSALDAVVEMFGEGELFPSIEQVSQRTGLSVRSLYRYFADPGELRDAAITRHRERWQPLAHLPSIGEGPVSKRIDDFVALRLRLYAGVEAAYRATVHNAARHPRLRDELARNRSDLRLQLERQFAPELALRRGPERDAVIAACDVLTQLDAVETLRRHRQLSETDTANTLRVGLVAILGAEE